jgi:hypothetical protein
LNSSNDLFLTFRKEMEEMSKKTKRLEKENLSLTRKHEATNQNIIKMAEERNRSHKEIAALRKKNENLEKLCRGMQAQGRGLTAPPTTADDAASASEYGDEDGCGALDGINDHCPIHGTKHVHDHTCLIDSHDEADGDDELDDQDRPADDGAEDSDALPAADRAPPQPLAKAAPATKAASSGKTPQLSNGTSGTPDAGGARKGGKRGASAGGVRAGSANGVKR